jgi:putative DNA primase/helicase
MKNDYQNWAALLDADAGIETGSTADGGSSPKPCAPSSLEIDPVASSAPDLSDIALANEFVEAAATAYRWSPGYGWMTWDGTVWKRDMKNQRYDLSKVVCARASIRAGSDSDSRRLASAPTVHAAIKLAETDQRLVVDSTVWDEDQMVLNTPNGVVDLRTGGMRKHGLDYFTHAARVAPDARVSCPTWDRFMNSVFMGDRELIEFMRRSMGYWITGDRREQVLFFLYGLGANGKSVLMELIQWIAGTYTLKLPAGVFMQTKGDRHPTELAQLRGKRLAVSSELDEGALFNESLIKEVTGDITLSARFMRQDFFEFAMTQKHVIVGNFKPRLRGGDQAMARRMLLVPFNASFRGSECDPHMLDKLKAEAPGILAWIVQGAVDWSRDGLAVPTSVRAASAEYMSEHDDIALWLAERCERNGECTAAALYKNFADWKKARGEPALSQTAWGTRLSTVPGITKRSSNGVRYAGIRLVAPQKADGDSES